MSNSWGMGGGLSIVAALAAALASAGCGESFSVSEGAGAGGNGGTTSTGSHGGGLSSSNVGGGGSAEVTATSAGGGTSSSTGCTSQVDCGPGETCVEKVCQCEVGTEKCSELCTSLGTDPKNCGACGTACALTCVKGACNDPVDLAAGGDTTCAVLALGDLYCWGRNDVGQLGGSEPAFSATPVKVPGLPIMQRVFVGKSTDATHICGLSNMNELYCWGSNQDGKLGNGEAGTGAFPPAKIPGSNIVSVSLGGQHTCLATTSNNVACWGNNDSEQQGHIGPGGNAPKTVSGLTADWLTAGGQHGCGLVNGALSCWGRNFEGQVGNGALMTPQPPSAVSLGSDTALEVAAGENHTCAHISNGTMRCWGLGLEGQLGDGNLFSDDKPVAVTGLPGAVTSIAVGSNHSGAIIGSDVWLWGRNAAGQVSTSEPGNVVTKPVKALAGKEAVQLALGTGHSCARVKNGEIYCWGRNGKGQIGNGTSGVTNLPPTLVDFGVD